MQLLNDIDTLVIDFDTILTRNITGSEIIDIYQDTIDISDLVDKNSEEIMLLRNFLLYCQQNGIDIYAFSGEKFIMTVKAKEAYIYKIFNQRIPVLDFEKCSLQEMLTKICCSDIYRIKHTLYVGEFCDFYEVDEMGIRFMTLRDVSFVMSHHSSDNANFRKKNSNYIKMFLACTVSVLCFILLKLFV